MAGHSKWKNIQHRKGRQDAIKGKIFAKLGREIYVAAREGDKDPSTNQKLRLAITKAKTQNMPNENIERAIKKACGAGDGSNYEHVTYEGYGPNGTAIMVEALTDNRNRTAADMRYIFSKRGGNLGEAGCVSWIFHRRGMIYIDLPGFDEDEEELMLYALEIGAEDFEADERGATITTSPEDFEKMKSALEEKGIHIVNAEVTFVPSNKIDLTGSDLQSALKLIEALEDQDDVQNVHTNMDADEEEIANYID